MKRIIKRAMAVVLTAVMLLTAAPLSGFVGLDIGFSWLDFSTKASALDSSGSCGENVTYTFDSETGLLTISGIGAMSDVPIFKANKSIKTVVIEYGVTSICNYAFCSCTEITSITIPDSVTSIGDWAFSDCSLSSIIIPDSVTSIGVHAFRNCTSLESVTISNRIRDLKSYMFYGCTGLESITIPNRITSIGDASFYGCAGLTNVTLSNSLTSIGDSAFYGCAGLTSIIIPDSVTSIGNAAFYGCAGLTNVTLSNSLTSIGSSTFYGCTGFTSIIIPDSVTSIGDSSFSCCSGLKELTLPCSAKIYNSEYTFYNCTNIEKITITKGTGTMQDYGTSSNSLSETTCFQYTPWYISRNSIKEITIENGVINIGESAFRGCSGLANITIPDSVESISANAFYRCTGLANISISNNVTSIGSSAFYDCSGLTNITIPDSVTSIGEQAFRDCNGLTYAKIGSSVAVIGDSAFEGCTGLINISIPDGVVTLGDYVFYRCSGLKSITIPDNVKSIGEYIFCDCINLTNAIIGKSVTTIGGYAFYGCTSLSSIIIPDNVTSIGESAFSGCSGLVSITIPDGITDIDNSMFSDCSNLTEISIPDGVINIGTSVFKNCSNLTSIRIPNGVMSIGDSAFNGCSKLKSIDIPYGVTNIYGSTFRSCTNLTEITIPDSVTSIGGSAFRDCTELTGIVIPNGVTSIGSNAFRGCSNLTDVTIPDNVTSLGSCIFAYCNRLTRISVDTYNTVYDSRENCNAIIETETNTLIQGCENTVIPNSVTDIGGYAFSGCSGLKKITIPDSVTNIGNYAFDGCSGLKELIMPCSLEIYNSRYIFNKCSNIEEITLTKGNGTMPDYDTSINSSNKTNFYQYTPWYISRNSVRKLIIEDGVQNIGNYAFYGCSEIKDLTIPSSAKIYNSEYTFYGCSGIEKITLTKGSGIMPDYGVSTDNSSSTTFYQYTPWYISRNSIKEIVIKEGVQSIGAYAFNGCLGLTDIVLPYSVSCIGESSFTGYNNLESLTVYNRNCTFADSIITYHTAIYGFTGSTADTYAFDNIFDFVAIDDTHIHVYDGDDDKTCNLCGAERYVCDHTSTHIEHKDSTCTEHGYDKSVCDICGATVSTTELPYKHDYVATVTAPTCTEKGYTTYICSICHESYKADYADSLGHNYVATVTDPTCTEQGYTTYTCSLCGESYTADYTEPLNHPHKTWRVTKNPTADSTGLMIETCDLCGAQFGEMEIPMLIPNYVTGITVSPNKLALNVGDTANITALITPDTAENKNVIWSSSDTAIATVADGIVTAKTPGVAVIIAQTEDGGYKDICVVRVASLTPTNGAVVDNENGLIYGIASNSADINSYVNTVDDTMTVECDSALLGTGSVVNIVKDDVVVDSYKIVVFGDVNGDGWYDGMDAVTVSCIANGMLTKDQIGEAAYMAADCNHDGVVDEFDVAILNQAGVLLANVDQTKTQEELAADSDYVEYLNLIDQQNTSEDTTEIQPEDETPDFLTKLIGIIEYIVKFITAFISKIF